MDIRLVRAVLTEDPGGVRHNLPGARYDKWKINSLGFRGEEVDLKKKEGQIRIVCLGGSETFGVFEDEGKEWPSQLGEMLKNQFPRVEVINVSVAGQKLKRKKAYVEKYVLPLKPDIVITTHGALLPIAESIRGVEGKRLRNKMADKRGTSSKEEDLSIRPPVRVLSKFWATLEGGLPRWLLAHLRMRRLRRRLGKKEKKYLVHRQPMDEVPENTILEFEEDWRIFVQYLKESQIVPILLTYPTLFTPMNKDFYRYLLSSIRLLCVELSEDGIIHASMKFNDAIRRITERYHVILIDNDLLMPKTLEYFVDYSHYTNQGAEFIARNIYQVLRQSELIKEAAIHHNVKESL